PQEAKISVKPENRMVGAYRSYEMNDVPTAGARDLGGPSWEKALVSRIREKNLAWPCGYFHDGNLSAHGKAYRHRRAQPV
ncbi:MAG: hypothetical protein L6437_00525, partial [Kiritimatiellae bacterium]|nr:hypothetical protein [Kiritimatiellia bacterium]